MRNVLRTGSCAYLGAVYYKETVPNLRACMSSLAAQTVLIPIILVVDGELGVELESVIDEFSYLDIHVLRLSVNSGLAAALNKALEKYKDKFEYFIRFDTDDVNLPTRTEKLLSEISRSKADVIASAIFEGDFIKNKKKYRAVPNGHLTIDAFRYRNPIFHPSTAFRIKSVMEVGGYENQPFFEDWLLWLKLANQNKKFTFLKEPLVIFRIDQAMLRRRFGWNYFRAEVAFVKTRRNYRFYPTFVDIIFLIIRLMRNFIGFKAFKFIFNLRR